jgi:hypothetical protein
MALARKAIVAGLGIALAAASAAAAGTAAGQGAQKRALQITTSSNQAQCDPAGSGASHGFAILNGPGKVGAVQKVNGEVSLKGGEPNTTYMVAISVGSQNCMPEGTLTTNGQGNGNAHINDATLSSGSYYIVLMDSTGAEQYATSPVTLI